uniref:Sodium/nucleoside cotransporter n=1 Tax=Crassostrea virginica TaxID=6565 RepID=A0A8B8E558_CRAVI|nr:sodium/nucleoside cotransporter 1-like [Crassostrea virginica]
MNSEHTSVEMKDQGEINHGYIQTETNAKEQNHDLKQSNGDGNKFQIEPMDNEEEENYTGCPGVAYKIQTGVAIAVGKHGSRIKQAVKLLFLVLYFVYFGYAMYYEFGDEGSIRLLVCTVIGVVLLLIHIFNRLCGSKIKLFDSGEKSFATERRHRKMKRYTGRFLMVAVFLGLAAYIIYDVLIDYPQNAVSIAGLALYIIIFYIFSKNPAKVKWRPVFWGFALQYIFALVILRTEWGYQAFQWLGDRVTEFLNYSNAGAVFVFGDVLVNTYGVFAFRVLPVVVFFYTVTSVLYYLGVMQVIVKKMGMFLSFCLGTSPAESLNAAGNIFVGMTEAPLMIQPFLENMTKSELHAVMTGGFATIAGSVLGAYVNFGVPANHLITASVMSAPAALAISKLAYPETERTKSEDMDRMGKSKDRNVIEAISSGAGNSVKVVAAIAVNVMAFLCVLEFVNMTLDWFGDRVGVDGLSFQLICSYVFYPIAFFMGTDVPDCRKVAELVGIKTFTNEFLAYKELSILIANRKNFTQYTAVWNASSDWFYQGDDIILHHVNQTLKKGIISDKSEVIATYALCGFSNFGSMGIFLGGMSALVPSRRGDLSQIVLRAMIAGNVACFLTGCIAGLLYKDYGT